MYGQRYGAKQPLQWSDAHEQPLRERHALWNDLVPIYQQARQREREILCEADSDLVPLYSELDALEKQLDELPRDTDEEREAWSETLQRTKQVRGLLWPRIAQLKRADAQVKQRLSTEVWGAAQKETYTIACGKGRRYPNLHWADCNDVHDAFWTAIRSRKSPRFHRPGGRAAIARQLMAHRVGGTREERPGRKRAVVTGGTLVGATWESLCSPRGYGGVRVLPYSLPRSSHEWKLLEISLTEESTLFLPFRLSVPIPPAALIKRVRVTRDRIPGKPRDREWHVVFSVDAKPRGSGGAGERTLYAGLGWRLTPQGLRILAGLTDRGEEWHVVVPIEWVWQADYVNELTSALRLARNAAAERVRKWRLEHPEVDGEFAERLTDACNPRYTRALLSLASDPHTPEDLRADLSTWAWGSARGKAAHAALLRAGSDPSLAAGILGEIRGSERVGAMRRKLIARRQVLYQQTARLVAQDCKRIVLGELDISELAQKVDLPPRARTLRTLAAPFDLRAALDWQSRKSGTQVETVNAANASRFCARHPEIDLYAGRDQARLWLGCERCGVALDRDYNYALNLIKEDSPDLFRALTLAQEPKERSRSRILNFTEELQRTHKAAGVPESRVRYTAPLALARREGNDK